MSSRTFHGFLFLFLVTFIFAVVMYYNYNEELHFKTVILKPPNYDKYREELELILNKTPYLWRSISAKFGNIDRIAAQRNWAKDFSSSGIINEMRTKRIFFENADFLHFDIDRELCNEIAPNLMKMCEFILPSNFSNAQEELRRIISAGERIDGVITIRNARWKTPLEIPEGMRQIMFIREPPHIAINADVGLHDALLSSYDIQNSDIPMPYLEWKYEKYEKSMEATEPIESKGKSELAVAVISNCNSKLRLDLINELKKYMKIDVFGACGKKLKNCTRVTCNSELGKIYKFYFAFENSNCRHYITEKFFFNALSFGMVPVVLGAHPFDYKRQAPPNSYILVENFPTMKELATYLKELDQDDAKYRKYLEWRKSAVVNDRPSADRLCRTCAMLFYADFVPPRSWNNTELNWRQINNCLPENQWRWIK